MNVRTVDYQARQIGVMRASWDGVASILDWDECREELDRFADRENAVVSPDSYDYSEQIEAVCEPSQDSIGIGALAHPYVRWTPRARSQFSVRAKAFVNVEDEGHRMILASTVLPDNRWDLRLARV